MERKPEWLRVRYNQEAVAEVAQLLGELKLNTVCKEANCPNLGECYRKHTAPGPGRAGERSRRRQKAGTAPRGPDLPHP